MTACGELRIRPYSFVKGKRLEIERERERVVVVVVAMRDANYLWNSSRVRWYKELKSGLLENNWCWRRKG